MKAILFLLLITLECAVFAQDRRSFNQINDSILNEAELIYSYDRAFVQTVDRAEKERKIRKDLGEVITYTKKDTLVSIVLSKENPENVIAEYRYGYVEDEPIKAIKRRHVSAYEDSLYVIKHRIMNEIQGKYEIDYPKGEGFLNPIFIPFTDTIRGKPMPLYKFYLTTETRKKGTIPFGQDYLFYADTQGKIFYNLQFNNYMETPISLDISDSGIVELAYPKREPYITPTDIYLFRKYASRYELTTLRVFSEAFEIWYNFDFERATIDLTED